MQEKILRLLFPVIAVLVILPLFSAAGKDTAGTPKTLAIIASAEDQAELVPCG
ncbi:MAG: hypothetical protein QME66_05310 [Candidatus Eisenbacteria bacterium]|nr:hypothetical protein [Candidatus Eisenbacteria bacterium]